MENITIDKLLFPSKKPLFVRLGISVLIYTTLISIIIAFCIYIPVYRENYTNFYENSSYDYFIQEIDREQVAEIAGKDFVEGIFPFSLMVFGLDQKVNAPANNGSDIALLTTSSFEGLKYSSYAPENRIVEDESILNDESRNPIIIDYSLSKTEGLSVGNTFKLYIKNAFNGAVKEFTVGAIYQNHCEFGKYDAVILVNDKTNSDFLQLDPYAGYTLAYVKANDTAALAKYLENDFYPHLSFKKDDFKSMPSDQQRTYYETRESRMQSTEKDLAFSKTGMYVIAAAAFITLVLIIKREHEKCIENYMYNIAILYSLGLKKRTLLAKLLKYSFIPITASIILACVLNKYVVFRTISSGLYVSLKIIVLCCTVCIVTTFAVVFLLTIILTAKRITAEKVLECINHEKRL